MTKKKGMQIKEIAIEKELKNRLLKKRVILKKEKIIKV